MLKLSGRWTDPRNHSRRPDRDVWVKQLCKDAYEQEKRKEGKISIATLLQWSFDDVSK